MAPYTVSPQKSDDATSAEVSTLDASEILQPNLALPGQLTVAMAAANALDADGALVEVTFTTLGAVGTQSPLDLVGGRINEGALDVALVDGMVRVTTLEVFVDGFEDGTTDSWE